MINIKLCDRKKDQLLSMILVSEVSSSEVYSSTAFIAGPKYSTFTGITEFLDFFFPSTKEKKKKGK